MRSSTFGGNGPDDIKNIVWPWVCICQMAVAEALFWTMTQDDHILSNILPSQEISATHFLG